jgi:hypothetical protein
MFNIFSGNKFGTVEAYSKEVIRKCRQNQFIHSPEEKFQSALADTLHYANSLFTKVDDSVRIRHMEHAASIVNSAFYDVDDALKRKKIRDQIDVISRTAFFSRSDDERANKAIAYIKDLYHYKYNVNEITGISGTTYRTVNANNEIVMRVRIIIKDDSFDYQVHFGSYDNIIKFTNDPRRPV